MSVIESIYHFTFVRHGESVGNAENRLQGQSDFPLSEKGRAQALALAQRFQTEGATFDAVLASPLSRARETAEILVKGLHLPDVELDPLWMERDNGKRSGLTAEEVRARYPEPVFTNPYESVAETGEGDWALYLRGGRALHQLLQRPAGRYLIVSHGAILNMVLYAILGIAPQPNYQGPRFVLDNTSLCRLRYYPLVHRWRVDVIGDRAHLGQHGG